MKNNKDRVLHPRYVLFWRLIRPIVFIISKFIGYQNKSVLKIKKGESYIILSNHQTSLDGLFLSLAFTRPFSVLVTDSFFSSRFAKLASYFCGFIPKKKGALDISSTVAMMKVIREGGNLAFYPEGNRSYAEFQFPFTSRFGDFLKRFNKPIVIFNSVGGFGVNPRFGNKRRKGKYYGEIKRIIQPEEYVFLSNEDFENLLKKELNVVDADFGYKYRSRSKAEYLERMFFVCPKCGKVETLVSKGDNLYCSFCGLKVTYNENLKLSCDDKTFKFFKLVDWYNFQIDFIKKMLVKDGIIFHDRDVRLFISNPYEKRKLLTKGEISLTKDYLEFSNGLKIPVSEIEIASPIEGTDLGFSTSSDNYLIKGSERFNALKYVLMFNKLETKMKLNNSDIYYPLIER